MLLAAVTALGCERGRPPASASEAGTTGTTAPAAAAVPFVDRAEEAGIRFVHTNGMSGARFFPEIMAPGVALFDMDNDGDLDVFVPQGHSLAPGATAPAGPGTGGRLFRNDLQIGPDGSRVLRFTDVTEASGIRATGYGMGIATGDIDNDGFTDLYLTAVGANQLYRNNGNGTFTDVSRASGTAGGGWGVSATFFDFDRDGWLDLFVGNYVRYSASTNIPCRTAAGALDYCAPFVYPPQPSRLYRNTGKGRFVEITAAAGMAVDYGPALGVTAADFNGDGWLDLYVAHDLQPNALWVNQHDGTFKNVASTAGVAVGPNGEPKSSMGVDAGDADNDGDEDLFVTELTGQGADLYLNDGRGQFTDASAASGVRAATLPFTGFGAAWFDADGDGWLDLLTVNGLVMGTAAGAAADDPFPFRQRRQLLRNLGNGRFEDVSARSGPAFERLAVGRGAAVGDLDNDGDPDVIVANDQDRLELLLNEGPREGHWLGLRLVDGPGGRDLVGTRVRIRRSDGMTIWRRARADGSYGSAQDPRVLIGLGATSAANLDVIWPDGRMESFDPPPTERYTSIVKGTGRASSLEESR